MRHLSSINVVDVHEGVTVKGDSTADESRTSVHAWLADIQRPEKPHNESRKLVVVLVIAAVAAIAAGVFTLLDPPPPEPDPSTLATVIATHRLPDGVGCSVDIQLPTGEVSTLQPFACASPGEVVVTSLSPEGRLEAKRIRHVARYVGAFLSAAIAFGMALPIAGAGALSYTAWQRRRRTKIIAVTTTSMSS